MGHKVHPKIYRTPVIYTWDSRWFAKKDYATFTEQDLAIREYLGKKFRDALIDAISVERSPKNVTVTILAAKPGYIIGRSGQGLDTIRKYIERKILQMQFKVKLQIREVSNPALSAEVVAQNIAVDIERRVAFRRIMKRSIDRVMKAGAQGVKIKLSGRLNGVDIARTETLSQGTVPLITLRSDVDYSLIEARTIYGAIGVKVWICRGQVFGRKDKFEETKSADSSNKKRSARPRPQRQK
ncbi:30S ribosomal protein S3 [Patescibacteria group bacterium]|nr:30S ribosomal protein S3 [Patescibacteria group bacterium]MBU1721579.1 30S ribosomal protein S3 [Patescibacteria group bacterium]MBU1901805.1 30S ribosomal protein S3 [Patescibacteria group bacterium]